MLIEVDFNSEEAIYIQLCNQIIMGIATSVIQEGDSLPSVRQLADRIGVNMHTVNKAYSVLKREGYISLDKRRGAVIALDIDKMEEMEENVYLSKFHAQKGHLEQLAELDNRFHDILYEACDSKMLEHQLKDFHQYVLRVRKKTLASANRGPKSNEEHEQIMEAIKAGNADLAEQLAHQHMINAYDNMVKNGLNEAYAQQDKPQE